MRKNARNMSLWDLSLNWWAKWDFWGFPVFENFNLVTFILWDSVHKNFHSIIHCTWSHKMENRRKLQLRLRCGHDSMFVLSYVLYNDYSCVFTVKDELDQQSFRMVSNCVLFRIWRCNSILQSCGCIFFNVKFSKGE